MKHHVLFIFLIFVLGYWSVAALTKNGYFPVHDDTQTGRVVAMGRALRNGQFPVRWVSDLGYGYGYPIFNFYGPLPYYFGGFLYALGIPVIPATKLMFGAGLMMSAIAMYALMSRWGRLPGLVGGLFYLYAPYHAVDAYVRGAVGEYWAMAFLPLVLLGVIFLLTHRFKIGITVGAIGMAGVILSHTILGYITVAGGITGLLLWSVMAMRSKAARPMIIPFVLLIAGGLGFSAFFWLPAMSEMHFTNVGGQIGGAADFRLHFVCIEQLWNSQWGFGGSAPGCADGISFMLGKLHVIAAAIAFILLIIDRGKTGVGGFNFILITILSLFFLLPVSGVFWERFPFFSYIQYPWRFLTFTVFGLSALAGMGVARLKHSIIRSVYACTLILILLMTYQKYFHPQYTYAVKSSAFETEEDLKFRVSSISDEYLPPDVPRPTDTTGIVRDTIGGSERLSVHAERETEIYSRIALLPKEDMTVRVNRAYFPGWEYVVNGTRVSPEVKDGLPYIRVPGEPTIVEFSFRNTPVRTFANAISVLAVIVFVLIYGKKTIS